MKKYLLAVALAIPGILLFSCGNDSQQPAVTVEPGGPHEFAQNVFQTTCATCHGKDGNLGLGGAKKLPQSTLDSAGIAAIITTGRNTMPSFKEQLDASTIAKLAGYVYSLRAGAPTAPHQYPVR